MYKVLIVEDEDDAARALTECLERYGREFGVELKVSRHASAVDFIREKRTWDLVFMDIDLPGVNGMEAAGLLRTYDPATPLIFVTNLAQYAVRGYEVDALDFIVKPVSYYSFSMRMDKAVRAMRRNACSHLTVQTRAGVRVIDHKDLVFVETVSHDLVFHTVPEAGGNDDEPLRVRGSLSKLEGELAGGPFLRISSGCIVNMDHIRSMQTGTLRMDDGTVLYASRSQKRAALDTFADYLGGSI